MITSTYDAMHSACPSKAAQDLAQVRFGVLHSQMSDSELDAIRGEEHSLLAICMARKERTRRILLKHYTNGVDTLETPSEEWIASWASYGKPIL